jgi:hypothetical protein
MSDFEVDGQQIAALVSQLGVNDTVDAFPADLLAPTWRALLKAGVIKGPENVDVSRVVVRLIGSHRLELLVPVRWKDIEYVKSVTVFVDKWTASGDLGQQLDSEAAVLSRALDTAYNQQTYDHEGPGQKPHN